VSPSALADRRSTPAREDPCERLRWRAPRPAPSPARGSRSEGPSSRAALGRPAARRGGQGRGERRPAPSSATSRWPGCYAGRWGGQRRVSSGSQTPRYPVGTCGTSRPTAACSASPCQDAPTAGHTWRSNGGDGGAAGNASGRRRILSIRANVGNCPATVLSKASAPLTSGASRRPLDGRARLHVARSLHRIPRPA
jgi:hypothetical protein